MAWNDLEHSIWKNLKQHGLADSESYLVAVSGGLDSVALLYLLKRLRPQAEIRVAHFHHGPTTETGQLNFRDDCVALIRNLCHELDVGLLIEESPKILQSEAHFREARWEFIRRNRLASEPIVTAHHLDDWVETLTLKLIRGVGPEGFIAFKMWDGEIFRPLLETIKTDILVYAADNKLKWIEDPSNTSEGYLRNWLRERWFKELDQRIPLGYQNYSRSLLRLCEELSQNQSFGLEFFKNSPELGLDRHWFNALSDKLQIKALNLFLRHHSIFNFTSGQLAELQKRLDKNQKDITFNLSHVKWIINETQIMLVS